MVAGGVWVGFAGLLRHVRGVNETISSLLLTYIAIAIMNFFVEGRCATPPSPTSRRPSRSARTYMVGNIPGTDVHWGLVVGIVACVVLYS